MKNRNKYVTGEYTMEIEDSGGTRFIFSRLNLTATQAQKIMTDMFFYGERVIKININDPYEIR